MRRYHPKRVRCEQVHRAPGEPASTCKGAVFQGPDIRLEGVEYLLRVEVNRGAAGDQRLKAVTATVFESGIELQRFEVDYSVHPYQPDPGRPVRIGANTHGTDWALRSLRVYYTDQR